MTALSLESSPALPLEIIHKIIDAVASQSELKDCLTKLALVSSACLLRVREHLFSTIEYFNFQIWGDGCERSDRLLSVLCDSNPPIAPHIHTLCFPHGDAEYYFSIAKLIDYILEHSPLLSNVVFGSYAGYLAWWDEVVSTKGDLVVESLLRNSRIKSIHLRHLGEVSDRFLRSIMTAPCITLRHLVIDDVSFTRETGAELTFLDSTRNPSTGTFNHLSILSRPADTFYDEWMKPELFTSLRSLEVEVNRKQQMEYLPRILTLCGRMVERLTCIMGPIGCVGLPPMPYSTSTDLTQVPNLRRLKLYALFDDDFYHSLVHVLNTVVQTMLLEELHIVLQCYPVYRRSFHEAWTDSIWKGLDNILCQPKFHVLHKLTVELALTRDVINLKIEHGKSKWADGLFIFDRINYEVEELKKEYNDSRVTEAFPGIAAAGVECNVNVSFLDARCFAHYKGFW